MDSEEEDWKIYMESTETAGTKTFYLTPQSIKTYSYLQW